MRQSVFVLVLILTLGGCCKDRHAELPSLHALESYPAPPSPREFRAAWVATVANIDWPSKPGLSTADQQRETIGILDRAKELHLNAIILQVRTACDAFYASKYEPWSYYLTGKQGQAPEPYYDPLQFWIDEAHRRGLELHAWFNPFRARQQDASYEEAANHISRTSPELVRRYGKLLWLDPGETAAVDHSMKVLLDVAERYDVDGIHIDDYFYPYPIPGIPFPDDSSWKKYGDGGGSGASISNRADWRRQNINAFIEQFYARLKATKKAVRFGISPFGIPRPGHPASAKGFDQYELLYADTELWLQRGWCDYWTPQLYWKIEAPNQPYRDLLEYWITQNQQKRHVWPGNYDSGLKAEPPKTWASKEIANQIELTRTISAQEHCDGSGNVHFSMKIFMQNSQGINEVLKSGPYREPALVPACSWLDSESVPAPRVAAELTAGGTLSVRVSPGSARSVWLWAVHFQYGTTWKFGVYPGHLHDIEIPLEAASERLNTVVISAVNRAGNESPNVAAWPH